MLLFGEKCLVTDWCSSVLVLIIPWLEIRSALEGECGFLAANLYAKSVFGEDALVNVSIEKQADGKLGGYIRIRSKTQGIALSLGDKITLKQKGGTWLDQISAYFFEALTLFLFQPYLCHFGGSIIFMYLCFASYYIYKLGDPNLSFYLWILHQSFALLQVGIDTIYWHTLMWWQFCAVALYCYVKLVVDFLDEYQNSLSLSLSLHVCVCAPMCFVDFYFCYQ